MYIQKRAACSLSAMAYKNSIYKKRNLRQTPTQKIGKLSPFGGRALRVGATTAVIYSVYRDGEVAGRTLAGGLLCPFFAEAKTVAVWWGHFRPMAGVLDGGLQ